MTVLISVRCSVIPQAILLGTMAACNVCWKERLLSYSAGVFQVNTEVRFMCFLDGLVLFCAC